MEKTLFPSTFTYPQAFETVLSCGHGGPEVVVVDGGFIFEKMQDDLVLPLRLGGTAHGAQWRVTCPACAKEGGLSPRMVWIGVFSLVAKGLMTVEGALL